MTRLRVAAVGDISFNDRDDERPSLDVLSAVTSIFRASDVVIANLESPLLREGPSVPGKCALRGSPEWAAILKQAGVHIVSLANNHVMDFGEAGLASTIQALEAAGIRYAGAGHNRTQANAPLFLQCNGIRVGVLARTSVPVSSPSYATDDRPGTAFLDMQDTADAIHACREQADVVMLSIHWGVEEYDYPSARQRSMARRFLDAGAQLVLGHHPHVLQGLEAIQTGLVCYSLGNLVFREVLWSYADPDGTLRTEVSGLSAENRRAAVLTVTLSPRGVQAHEFVPTRIDEAGCVRLDDAPQRALHLARLSSGLKTALYPIFWRLYSLRREWDLRVAPLFTGALSLSKICRLRPRHVKELGTRLLRSARITLGKTTNPYE
jgi:poly-gamma-glutamate capsule biosynthesis protein CapA/YwtB (metallophosphatase superfamily)